MKPKVLISTFTFPPASNGVANAVYVHAKIMKEIGCEVDIATSGDVVSQDKQDGLSIRRFPISGKGHLLSPHRGAIKELHTFLDKNRWDIVFMHCWQAWSTNCLLDYFESSPRTEKLILVSHGISTNTNIHPFPLNWIRYLLWLPYRHFTVPRYLRLLTDLVILWDHYDTDRYLDHVLARRIGTPIKVIPNAARYDSLKVKRPSLRFADEELAGGVILSVGNYSASKNELLVLEAYRKSGMTDIPLIFVGPRLNRYATMLQKSTRHWNLHNVQFLEHLTKEEIDWLYKHAVVFLFGSKTECQPMVILDCLASGTPYLSTDVGCVKCLARENIVSSVEEMAFQLKTLLQNPAQRAEQVRQGLCLYEKEFSLSSVRDKWKDLLMQLLPPR